MDHTGVITWSGLVTWFQHKKGNNQWRKKDHFNAFFVDCLFATCLFTRCLFTGEPLNEVRLQQNKGWVFSYLMMYLHLERKYETLKETFFEINKFILFSFRVREYQEVAENPSLVLLQRKSHHHSSFKGSSVKRHHVKRHPSKMQSTEKALIWCVLQGAFLQASL